MSVMCHHRTSRRAVMCGHISRGRGGCVIHYTKDHRAKAARSSARQGIPRTGHHGRCAPGPEIGPRNIPCCLRYCRGIAR